MVDGQVQWTAGLSRAPGDASRHGSVTPPTARPCSCGHSSSAHHRNKTTACSFCRCQSYSPDPYIVEHEPAGPPDEVWSALELLVRNPAFAGLSPVHVTAMVKRGHKRLLMAGTVLMNTGDSSEKLYLLLKGQVQVERPATGALPTLSAELGPGDIVGEVGLLHGMRHTAAVTALSDLRVLEITRENLQAVFHKDQRLLLAFLRMVHHRIKEAPTGDPATDTVASLETPDS